MSDECKNSGMIHVTLGDDTSSSKALDNATKLLAGISGGIYRAAGSAMKRAATSGEAYAARAVNQHYYIKVSDFKSHTKSKKRIFTSLEGTTVEITYRGVHIPLIRFKTRIGADGKIRSQVKKDASAKIINRAFIKSAGKYPMGIYQRVGKDRIPLEQFYGPSVPQMMGANDDVVQAINDKVSEVFEKRMEHEVTAILNGWRK